MSERTLMDVLDELYKQSELMRKNPAHSTPRCTECHWILDPIELRHTASGFYFDGPNLCGHCKSARNMKAAAELRQENEEDFGDGREDVEEIPGRGPWA